MLDALPLDILLLVTTLLPPESLFALSGVSQSLHALFHAPPSAEGGGDWFARRLRRAHPSSAGSSLLAGRGAGLALAKAAAVGDCHMCGRPGDVGVYAASAAFAGVRGGGWGRRAATGADRGGGGSGCRGRRANNDRGASGVGGAPGGGSPADGAAGVTLFPICAACYAADACGTTTVVDVRVTHEVHPGLGAPAAAAAARSFPVRGTLWTEYVGGGGGARWVVARRLLVTMIARPPACMTRAAPLSTMVTRQAGAPASSALPAAVPVEATGCPLRRRDKRRRGEPGHVAAAAAAAAADTPACGDNDSEAGSDGGSPRTVRPARRRHR